MENSFEKLSQEYFEIEIFAFDLALRFVVYGLIGLVGVLSVQPDLKIVSAIPIGISIYQYLQLSRNKRRAAEIRKIVPKEILNS